MRFLFLALYLLSQYVVVGQDSCVAFNDQEGFQARFMGMPYVTPQWEEINYVVHVHHTDSFPNSYVSESVIMSAHEHLNEEFDEAMLTFDLVAILYHDFDEFWGAPTILEPNSICLPYSQSGFIWMDEYVEDLIWDRESFMNVHIFPQFCSGILGFAWTAYSTYTDLDGVWVRTDVFGNEGPQLESDVYNENKTLIHEVGHFVSLHHVFRNVDNCGQNLGDCLETGDYVCDTPPTKLNWSCENPICPPGAYDYTPNNHMDYYVDSCRTNFTPGQIERMHAALPVLRPGLTDQPAFCLGDLNNDLVVGQTDFLMFLANWGDISWEEGDLNGDGYSTVMDFQILIANYGTICFGAELDPFYREEQFNYPKQERGRSPFPSRW